LTGAPALASSLVPLVVRVTDTAGKPLPHVPFYIVSGEGFTSYTEWVTTGADGTATTKAIPNSTAVATLVEGGNYSDDGSGLTVNGGSLVTDSGYYHPSVATGTSGATLSVTLPRLERHDIRVVTEDGDPVAGAQVSPLGLVSTQVIGADGTPYRVRATNQYGLFTDSSGQVSVTAYAQEPDSTTVPAWKQGGQATAGAVFYNPTVSSQLQQWMPYSTLLQSSTEIVLPFVPVVASASTEPGKAAGTATVSATLLQPDSTGHRTPIAKRAVEIWSEPNGSAAPKLLGTTTSTAGGRATFQVNITRATRMALHLRGASHVAAILTVQTRRVDRLAATGTTARVGHTVRLPHTSGAGLSVTWRSSTPRVCAIDNNRNVRALRAGTCRLVARTPGNTAYGVLTVHRSIRVNR
jgi:hypothetical protein